ncbi:MAG: polyprenyl synthetase family protein [candidate division WOR-3 bacterium]|nr:MAG: polyprenyl synthetase family protein [candidate division WOR-3 bacterium]
MTVTDINTTLGEYKVLIDKALYSYFSGKNRLFDMMYYSLDNGKRIRPILVIATFKACGGSDMGVIMPIACGLELIHTYSLIHDDLPSMDDDDFRRGKASAHKQYGEAAAILSGDGLFAYAFELFTQGSGSPEQKTAVITHVSQAVGPGGVVYGQVLDTTDRPVPSPKMLRKIHLNKTAKFIAASVKCGAIMGSASQKQSDALHDAGIYLGMLFQYTDDILDITGRKERLGKTPGKDAAAGKLTAAGLYGLDGARFRAERYAQRATDGFLACGKQFQELVQITDFVLKRTY